MVKRLGLVARADNSGLATQTWEFWRHMKPERTLIVLARHTTRGDCRRERYDGLGDIRVTGMYPTSRDAQWLVNGVDTVFSAETFYGNKVYDEAHKRGVRTVLQANPELYDFERADVLCPATPWRLDVFPHEPECLSVPVNRDVLPTRRVDRVHTFYHVHSTAMEDRNGTLSVLNACRYMRREAKLFVRGEPPVGTPETLRLGPVEIEWLGRFDGPYFDHWPLCADALVLPRRFGGLCLPIQEAAALGLPIITLDHDPYEALVHSGCEVPSHAAKRVPMKGGMFEVFDCRPQHLARSMDYLIDNPSIIHLAAKRSMVWAEAHSWEALLPQYEALFR